MGYCVYIVKYLRSDFLQYGVIFHKGLQALSEILLSIAKKSDLKLDNRDIIVHCGSYSIPIVKY